MRPQFAMPGDYLIKEGETSLELVFVVLGRLQLLRKAGKGAGGGGGSGRGGAPPAATLAAGTPALPSGGAPPRQPAATLGSSKGEEGA